MVLSMLMAEEMKRYELMRCNGMIEYEDARGGGRSSKFLEEIRALAGDMVQYRNS